MYYLVFFGWLMSATALYASSLLGCLETDGVVSQLAIVANSRGTYDAVVAGGDGRLRYLAIDLSCDDQLSCVAGRSSPHAGSRVSVATDQDDRRRVVIESPLVGSETLVVEECLANRQGLPATLPSSKKGCLAFFRGAYYNPDLGVCVVEKTSGCRNPYPYLDINECQQAMHLPTEP